MLFFLLTFGNLAGVKAPGQAECWVCHDRPALAIQDARGQRLSLYVDVARFRESVHGQQPCTACHTNFPTDPAQAAQVVRGKRWPQQEFLARLSPRNQVAMLACMRCHEAEAAEYRASVHGEAVKAGNPDAPICIDCHGHHFIPKVSSPESQVRDLNVPATCAKCHQNALVMAKYDVRTEIVESFAASFHGEKLALGSARAADCTSCHGVHNIHAPDDPRSTVFPANRPATCGQCHRGAEESFAAGFTHTVPTRQVEALVYWIGVLYTWFIFVTIGGMGLYILLDVARRVANWLEK